MPLMDPIERDLRKSNKTIEASCGEWRLVRAGKRSSMEAEAWRPTVILRNMTHTCWDREANTGDEIKERKVYPVQEFSSGGRQDVDVFGGNEKTQEAHGEHFSYWHHSDLDCTQYRFTGSNRRWHIHEIGEDPRYHSYKHQRQKQRRVDFGSESERNLETEDKTENWWVVCLWWWFYKRERGIKRLLSRKILFLFATCFFLKLFLSLS